MTGGETACWFCSLNDVRMLCLLLPGVQILEGQLTEAREEKLSELAHVHVCPRRALSVLTVMVFLFVSHSKDRARSTLPWKKKKNHIALEEVGKFFLFMDEQVSFPTEPPASRNLFFLRCIM